MLFLNQRSLPLLSPVLLPHLGMINECPAPCLLPCEYFRLPSRESGVFFPFDRIFRTGHVPVPYPPCHVSLQDQCLPNPFFSWRSFLAVLLSALSISQPSFNAPPVSLAYLALCLLRQGIPSVNRAFLLREVNDWSLQSFFFPSLPLSLIPQFFFLQFFLKQPLGCRSDSTFTRKRPSRSRSDS